MSTKDQTIAKPLAPEDICADTYVAILDVMEEYLPVWSLLEPYVNAPKEPLRFRWLPCDCGYCNQSSPMKVLEVCLPFVLVKTTEGKQRTLDVRRHRLAQLSDDYGHKVFKMLRDRARAKSAASL